MVTDPGLSLILVTEFVEIRRRANGVVLLLSNKCWITITSDDNQIKSQIDRERPL